MYVYIYIYICIYIYIYIYIYIWQIPQTSLKKLPSLNTDLYRLLILDNNMI